MFALCNMKIRKHFFWEWKKFCPRFSFPSWNSSSNRG